MNLSLPTLIRQKENKEGIVSCHVIKSEGKIQAAFMESFSENFCYDDEQLPVDSKLIFDPVSLLFLPLFILLFVLFLGKFLFFSMVYQMIKNGFFKEHSINCLFLINTTQTRVFHFCDVHYFPLFHFI